VLPANTNSKQPCNIDLGEVDLYAYIVEELPCHRNIAKCLVI